MIGRSAAVAWLLFVWVALTGSFALLNVVAGLLVSVAILSFFRPAGATKAGGSLRPWHAARFFVFFIVQFVQANFQVALAVIRPERVRRKRAIIAVPVVAASEITTTMLANAVSLTPGTFILEMRPDPPTMYVHVLQLSTVRTARLEILELERYIVLAFGPPGAAERVRELMARTAAGPGE